MRFKFTLIFIIITMFTNAQNSALKYVVREPKIKSEAPPLLILLHGVGSNEMDLFSFVKQLPDKYLVVSVRAPITLSEGSYAWYQVDFSSGKPKFSFTEAEKSRVLIIQFIEQLKQKHAFDVKQIYLCGFSQGAIMSYSLALTRPDLIKGIAAMSGRILEEIKPLMVSKDKLKNEKIFISHGVNDGVLGFHYATESVEFFKTLGLNPVFKQYQAGHEINAQQLSDLIHWLQ